MTNTWEVIHGDCLDALRALPDNSVDAVVTDPPYGLSFMGKKWDYDVPATEVWAECLRVLKPGGHLLAFAGTRTQHRMCVRIEDAGFEIRDMIAWVYGQGFPKSLDVSKAIDKAAGARGHEGRNMRDAATGTMTLRPHVKPSEYVRPEAITDSARQWSGWGTALKPAMEPITVARKPLDGTVAANVQEWGTGAINVDGCRVGTDAGWSYPNGRGGRGWHGRESLSTNLAQPMKATLGRWPANLIHDGSEEVEALTGSAARFFYCAKASRADRDAGCDGLPKQRPHPPGNEWATTACFNGESGDEAWRAKNPNLPRANHHPTVKPTALMQYLCRLVTPPGGTVLDPFTGSGSTGRGAILEGFNFIGIEREAEYVEIARARIAEAASTKPINKRTP